MTGLFKDFFSTAALLPMTAEKDFDALMNHVEEDEMDLNKLEHLVHDEFCELEAEVAEIEKGVDRAVK